MIIITRERITLKVCTLENNIYVKDFLYLSQKYIFKLLNNLNKLYHNALCMAITLTVELNVITGNSVVYVYVSVWN